jgi:leader peptidase (prepilin peptidase) / N-methyltransferase
VTHVTFALVWICAVFGVVFGSFLNVVIYRVPKHLSIIRPPSACPVCAHPIRTIDNVPVISWLILRGKCRDCGTRISPRYLFVEVATGALFAGAAAHLGDAWTLPACCAFLGGLLALAIIDLETLTLPRSIVWIHLAIVSALLLMASAITGHWRDLVVGVICALVWSGLYFSMYLVSPRAIGFGDVRLALVLGLTLGYFSAVFPVLAFLVSNVVGVLVTTVLIVTKRIRRQQPVPYGVFLAIGTTVVFFCGSVYTSWYNDTLWRPHL